MVQGSCLCGGVAWKVGEPLELMTHCHCSMCRKQHGGAFATYVAGSADSFRWLRGETLIEHFRSSPGLVRPFCSRCGSVVAGTPDDGRVFMPAGNLDDDPGTRPLAHIFVGSKAAWHEIRDGLTQYTTHAPGWRVPELALASRPPASREGVLRGSCLCGEAAYEVAGSVQGIVKCHCSRCRKARSAAHGANLLIRQPELRWIQGRDLVAGFKPPDASHFMNHFCRSCGGILPRLEPDADLLALPAGSLDRRSETFAGVEEKLHIFVASKAPWYEIPDDLPQLPESPSRAR